jgi:predicted DNA binding protein
MFVAKIRVDSKGTLIGEKAKQYNLEITGFPLSYSYEKDHVIVQLAGNVFGEKKDIKNFVYESKKEKRVVNLEENDGFIIASIKEPTYTRDLYQKNIFFISPAIISSKGYEIIEIGSFDRELLVRVIDLLEKNLNGELIFLKEKKIKTMFISKISPDLTDKQKKAFDLALKNGYYEVPRKISVEKLAKLSGLSFSTFQVHLRKAEQKLIPSLSYE